MKKKPTELCSVVETLISYKLLSKRNDKQQLIPDRTFPIERMQWGKTENSQMWSSSIYCLLNATYIKKKVSYRFSYVSKSQAGLPPSFRSFSFSSLPHYKHKEVFTFSFSFSVIQTSFGESRNSLK